MLFTVCCCYTVKHNIRTKLHESKSYCQTPDLSMLPSPVEYLEGFDFGVSNCWSFVCHAGYSSVVSLDLKNAQVILPLYISEMSCLLKNRLEHPGTAWNRLELSGIGCHRQV